MHRARGAYSNYVPNWQACNTNCNIVHTHTQKNVCSMLICSDHSSRNLNDILHTTLFYMYRRAHVELKEHVNAYVTLTGTFFQRIQTPSRICLLFSCFIYAVHLTPTSFHSLSSCCSYTIRSSSFSALCFHSLQAFHSFVPVTLFPTFPCINFKANRKKLTPEIFLWHVVHDKHV